MSGKWYVLHNSLELRVESVQSCRTYPFATVMNYSWIVEFTDVTTNNKDNKMSQIIFFMKSSKGGVAITTSPFLNFLRNDCLQASFQDYQIFQWLILQQRSQELFK